MAMYNIVELDCDNGEKRHYVIMDDKYTSIDINKIERWYTLSHVWYDVSTLHTDACNVVGNIDDRRINKIDLSEIWCDMYTPFEYIKVRDIYYANNN